MTVAELMSAADIVAYVEDDCGVELEFKNGEYWGLSPLKEEKTPSFAVNEDKQTFYDFSTGKGGNILTLIRELYSCTLQEAIKRLREYTGIDEDCEVLMKKTPSIVRIAKHYKPSALPVREPGRPEVLPEAYMERYEDNDEKLAVWTAEGMSLEVLKKFQVRYDPFSNCLVYPIRNYNGQIVNVGGRTLEPDFKERGIRKYTYFKKWNGEMNVLFGLSEHRRQILEKDEIILFEGAKSVFLAETYGYDNGAALLTSHLSEGQFRYLIGLGVRVVFALDEEIDIAKDKNIQRLKRYCRTEYVYNDPKNPLLSPKMSPVDKGKEVWNALYERRKTLL